MDNKRPLSIRVIRIVLSILVLLRMGYYFHIVDVISCVKGKMIFYNDIQNKFLFFMSTISMIMADLLLLCSVLGVFKRKRWVLRLIPITFMTYLGVLIFTSSIDPTLFVSFSFNIFTFLPLYLPFSIVYISLIYIFSLPNISTYFTSGEELETFIRRKAIIRAKTIGFIEVLFGVVGVLVFGPILVWFPFVIMIPVFLIVAGIGMIRLKKNGKNLSVGILWLCMFFAFMALFNTMYGLGAEYAVIGFALTTVFLWQLCRKDLNLVLIPTEDDVWAKYKEKKSFYKDKEFLWSLFISLIILFVAIAGSRGQWEEFAGRNYKNFTHYIGGIPADATPTRDISSYVKKYYYRGTNKLLARVPMHYKEEHGTVKEYFESGKLKSIINYKDGKKEGLEIRYYENGKIKRKILHKNDKKN